MTNKSTLMLGIVLMSSLGLGAGCKQSGGGKPRESTNKAEELKDQGKVKEAAEVYSRMGELLLSRPEGIAHAEVMFQKALETYKSDEKANFYSAVLAPTLKAKGFVTRFKNVIPDNKLSKLETDIKASGVKEFADFALVMPEGVVEANKLDDGRKFFRQEYVAELDKSLLKLEQIKKSKFTLDVDLKQYDSNNQSLVDCQASESQGLVCTTVREPGPSQVKKVSIDEYDVKALSIVLKTQKNALVMAYSVGLIGLEEVVAKLKKEKIMTDKIIVNALKSKPNLLKIDGSKDDLKNLFDHSEEVLNDLLDFSKISKEVCGNSERAKNLASDICISDEAVDRINELLMNIAGPQEVIVGVDANNVEVSVEVNLKGLVDSKVISLQELLPNKFDGNGKAVDFKDPTFGGIIPNGDLISKLKTVVK